MAKQVSKTVIGGFVETDPLGSGDCDDSTGYLNPFSTGTDCDDEDCDGVGFCECAVEATCDDGEDNDADGLIDCAYDDCIDSGQCEVPVYGVPF